MSEQKAKCCFCKSDTKYFTQIQGNRDLYCVECPICNLYFISRQLWEKLKDRKVDNALLWCISENIKFNAKTDPITTSWHSRHETLPKLASDIVVKWFDSYLDLKINHASKPMELLVTLADSVPDHQPFGKFRILPESIYRAKINGFDEAAMWVDELIEEGLLDTVDYKLHRKSQNRHLVTPEARDFTITTKGWSVINRETAKVSSTGFVAMSFSYAERNKLENAITEGCKAAGFAATIVDRHEYVGGVVDEIMAKINSAKFVVADLTEHKHGVYFEAGYAMARGVPVIFTVRDADEETKKIHFDVKHLNQIRWKDYDDLQSKISNRLKALFS